MAKQIGDQWDYNLKAWALNNSIWKNKKGTATKKILKDAEQFYNFIVPEKAVLYEIKNKKEKD
jgi:hypothetical protein